MIRAAVWWEERLWAEGLQATWFRLLQRCSWLQQPDHLHYITMQISIGLSFFLLFYFISLFDGVMESHGCLCKCYNAYLSTETLIFSVFLAQNNFFHFSFDTSSTCYIACQTLVAPNITFNFHWYCMLQSFSCVWCLFYYFFIYFLYSGCHAKIFAILIPKNSMCPILPLNKNYLKA